MNVLHYYMITFNSADTVGVSVILYHTSSTSKGVTPTILYNKKLEIITARHRFS